MHNCEFQEKYEKELQKHLDEAGSKANAALARAEEQGRMIESFHTSVSFFRGFGSWNKACLFIIIEN